MSPYRIIFIGKENHTNSFISEAIKLAFDVSLRFLDPARFFLNLDLPLKTDANLVVFDINSSSGIGNAPENIQKIRRKINETPLLVITPYENRMFVEPLMDAGADGLISSTPSEKKIRSTLNELLDHT